LLAGFDYPQGYNTIAASYFGCIINLIDYGPAQIGKWLILMGLMLCGIGAEVLGLFRLPRDISAGGKYWHIVIPITSCLILSLALTLLMRIISQFLK
jgi:hypothetical protein